MSQRRFAVFDIDGTLIRWQLYHAVVDKLAKKGHLGLDAHEQIHHQRMVWKHREQPESFDQYEQFLVNLYEKALVNLRPSVFDRIAKEVVAEYKDQVYTYTRDLVKTLAAKGYALLAISGSHHELVSMVVEQYGFLDCVGSKFNRVDNRFTGQRDVASHDKKQALELLIEKHHLTLHDSYAVGDTDSDLAMLQLVEHPIVFNPNRRLYDQAIGLFWPIVVERKNVIYQLKYQSGRYELAQTNG